MACMLGPMDEGNVELVKLLIEAGADPNIPAVMTITPDPDDSASDDGWVPAPKQWSPLILAVRKLRILSKQNTALLSSVCVCVCPQA